MKLKIGKFILSSGLSSDNQRYIWICDESGEGGAFKEADLEKWIAKFYAKYF